MKTLKLLHYGIHKNSGKNLGDKVHFFLIREWFNQFFFPRSIKWKLKQIRNTNTLKDIKNINKNIDLILIGGGGLFLIDNKKSYVSNSGWYLNMNNNLLSKIEKPIVVFGVGYNRFRKQKEFNTKFKTSINLLNEKSIFFGLRNKGSIRKVSNYLTKPNTLKLQPCITTIIRKLDYFKKIKNKEKNYKKIAIGLSADRIKYRFQNNKNLYNFIECLEDLIILWKNKGYKVDIVLHKKIDMILAKKINLKKIKTLNIVDLTDVSVRKAINYYQSISLLFAMRGHNQLIAAGLCVPFFSIITHDKIKYFAEENNLKKYSVEINDPDLKSKILSFSNKKNNIIDISKILKKILTKNFQLTHRNSLFIKNYLISK
jgi:polysaccharide pyruvyl transferase WcaK-like protein